MCRVIALQAIDRPNSTCCMISAYLALVEPATLFGPPFLLGVGALLLIGHALLGKLYWFSAPFGGILLASALYLAGLIAQASGA